MTIMWFHVAVISNKKNENYTINWEISFAKMFSQKSSVWFWLNNEKLEIRS